MNKKFRNILFIIVALVMSIAMVGCDCSGCDCSGGGGGGGSTGFLVPNADGSAYEEIKDSYTLEFGESFLINVTYKDNTKPSYTITDEAGNEVSAQYGMLRPNKPGTYTIHFVAGNNARKDVTIICQDTIAPVVTLQSYVSDGIVGENVPVPYYTATDKADIDTVRSGVEVKDPAGNDVVVSGGTFQLVARGVYVVTLKVYDKNGLCTEKVINVRSAAAWEDTSLANDNVLMDFNEDGKADGNGYYDLAFDVNNQKEATREIITEGYPTIADDVAGNGVMVIYDPESQSNTMQDIYTKFRLHTGFNMGEAHASALKIRFAVSTDTDYVHFMRDKFICQRFNLNGGLKANTWYEMIVDPLQWGYYTDLTNFIIKFRDKGQTKLYIDEISYVDPVFVDEDLAEGSLGDFNEAGYESIAYQNVYNDPTTSRSYCVDGTTFEQLTEGYPAANDDSSLWPGLGATDGVLKATVGYDFGGISYMFPELLNVEDISVLRMKMYFQDPMPQAYIFGFFDDKGLHLSNTSWYTGEDYHANAPIVEGQWMYIDFTGEFLKTFTQTDKISGFFLQAMVNRSYFPEMDMCNCVFYIDEITYVNKASAEETEWVDGSVITKFESDASMKQVIQPTIRKIGHMGTATHERVTSDVYGATDGVLKITSNYRKYTEFTKAMYSADQVLGDGAIYIFDKSLKADDITQIILKYAVPEGHDIASITFAAVCSRSNFIHTIATVPGYELVAGQWNTFGFSSEDMMGVVGNLPTEGLAIIIKTNSDNANNVVYIDEITMYDIDADVTAPTGTFDAYDIEVVEGFEVGTDFIVGNVTDDMDPMPKFELDSVLDPDGNEVDLYAGKFVPEISGEYTYNVVCYDYAGNYSDPIAVTATITVTSEEDYHYLEFGPSAIDAVSPYEDERLTSNDLPGGPAIERVDGRSSIVIDNDASDNFALETTIDMSGTGHVGGTTVAIADGRNIADIHQIEFRIKTMANSGGNWLRIALNEYASVRDENAVTAFNTDSWKGGYYTVIITAEKIQEAIADGKNFGSEILESISFVSVDTMSLVQLRVDYVRVSYIGDDATITFDYAGGVDEDGETSYEGTYSNGALVDWVPVLTKADSVFLGWTKNVSSYVLFDKDTELVSGDMTLTAVWFDLDWFNFAEADSAWVVQHKRVETGWGDNDTSSHAADWADDGYATGRLLVDGGPEAESHAWVEIALPDLKISDLSYFSVKVYNYSAGSKQISINFNNKGEYSNGNWSGARKFTINPGVNTINIPLAGAADEFLTELSFGETVNKMFILADQNNDPVIAIDGVYFIGAGSPMALYTEKFYLEQEDGSYAEATELTNQMVGPIDGTATIRNIAIDGYTFDSTNVNNSLTGTVLEDGTLVLARYYTANPVNVTYNYNGASDGTTATEATVEQKYNSHLAGPTLTLAGKTFVGWSTDVAGDSVCYDLVTEAITVYPVWIDADLGAYNFADEEVGTILTHYSAAPEYTPASPDATDADWAEDGRATGAITITGTPTAVDHSYIIIALPKLKTTEIERIQIRLNNTHKRNLYINFNDLGAWDGAKYENCYTATNVEPGVQTIVIDGSFFTEEAFGEYVTSLWIAAHWTEGTVAIDSVGFKAGAVNNLATYSEKIYLQQTDGSYAEETSMATSAWGIVGNTASAKAAEIGGYVYNASATGTVASGAITADGSLTLASYYDRASNEVTFDYNGGTVGTDTTATATLYGGDSLDSITAPTSEGKIFMGWSTTADGANQVTAHNGAEIYYAVWYDLADLDFGSAGAIGRVGAVLKKAGVSTAEGTLKASDLASDGQVGVFTVWQNPEHNSYTGVRIDLPKLDMTKLTSITIRYFITNSDFDKTGSNAVYLRANTPETANNTNGILLAAGTYGTITEKVITNAELQALIGTDTTLNALYLQGSGWADNRVHIDYVHINTTDETISDWYAANYSSYVVKHYVENAEGEFVADETATETYNRIKVGTEVTATAKNNLAGVYNPDNVNNVLTGTVVAGSAIELKLYYEVGELSVTYDYNGGTDGTNSTKTVTQLNSDNLISGEGITKDGYVFMGWSTTQQTESLNVDEDGLVGADSTFYAVWYNLDWLTFDNLSTTTYEAITAGSKSHWEAPRTYKDNDEIVLSAKQWPTVTDVNYVHGVINMPKLKIADLFTLTINYRNEVGTSENWYMDINGVIAYADTDSVDLSNTITIAPSATATSIVLTKDQLLAIADGDEVIETLNFCVKTWNPRSIAIDSIEYVTAAEAAEYTTEYYLQQTDGSYAIANDLTEAKTVAAGTAVTANQKAIAGYVFDETNASNVISGTVAADGSLVLKVYYNIISLSVTYDYNGGEDGDGNTSTTAEQLGTDALIANPGLTKEGCVFVGWSATKSDTSVATDEDGLVGGTDTFYAVWYNLDWLTLDTESEVYDSLTAGSMSYWEVPREQLADGYVFSTRQNPHSEAYVYGVLRLPHIDLSQLVSLNITYKRYEGNANNPFYLGVNKQLEFAEGNYADDTAGLKLENVASSTTVSFNAAQILAVAEAGTTHLDVLYIGAGNYNAQSILIENIEVISNDPVYPVPVYNVVYDANGGTFESGTTITNSQEAGSALITDVPTRTSYNFRGWATDAEGYNIVTTVTGDKLYASWYNLKALDMGVEYEELTLDANGQTYYFQDQGTGKGYYSTGEVNFYEGQVPTTWTEDGKYVPFHTWQNPTHETQYCGSIIRLPVLDLDKLESITLRYIIITDTATISDKTVYLVANTPKTANTTDGIAISNQGTASFTQAVELTITKDQLLATVADADDKSTIHTLYIDGYAWTAAHVLMDSITINTTQEDIVTHYNAYAEVTTEIYLQDSETGDFVKSDALTTTAELLKDSTYAPTTPVVPGYTFDEGNANNVTSVTVAEGATLKFYYTLPSVEVTYNFNGGKDGADNESTTITQYGNAKLLDGTTLVRDGYTFYGWSTTQQESTLDNVDADGLVGGDTAFYALWYKNDWLQMSNATSNAVIAAGSAALNTSATVSDTASTDGVGISFRVWQCATHASYTKGMVKLPHVDVSKLVSISIRYSTTGNTHGYVISANCIPTANSAAGHIAMDASVGAWTTKTITAADLTTAYAGIEYVDYLVFSGLNYNDRYITIDYITIEYAAE